MRNVRHLGIYLATKHSCIYCKSVSLDSLLQDTMRVGLPIVAKRAHIPYEENPNGRNWIKTRIPTILIYSDGRKGGLFKRAGLKHVEPRQELG